MEEQAKTSRGLFQHLRFPTVLKVVFGSVVGTVGFVLTVGHFFFRWFNSPASTSQNTFSAASSSHWNTSATLGAGSPATTQSLTGPVYLDTLPPAAGTSPDRRGEVNIGGVAYPHGLQYQFANAECPPYSVSTTYGIPRGAKHFAAVIGNDTTQTNSFWTGWHLTYMVVVDGLTEYVGHSSGALHDAGPSLNVAGHGQLELEIRMDCPAGGVLADWGNPALS
jgi:hypothetical protein